MQTFAQHYYLQEKLSSEFRRALTSNLFKKRKVGIDLGKWKYKKVVEAEARIFAEVLNQLQSGARDFFTGQKEKRAFFGKKGFRSGLTSTLRKLSRTDIKGVYQGEIDSGESRIKGNPISSLVFEVQNGAKIAFITTQDGEDIRYYISTNRRGNDFFRENLGTTLEQISAESIAKGIDKKDKKKEKDDEETKTDEKEPDKETEPEEDEKEPEEENEYGIIDITTYEMNELESYWGDGKKGPIKGGLYLFRNKFKKERVFGFGLGYSGYKYFDNVGNAVYLIDFGDGKNAAIGFKDRQSFDWARRNEMLGLWRTINFKTKIRWEKGSIEDLHK